MIPHSRIEYGMVITITLDRNVLDGYTYDYKDRILKNIHKNIYEIFYSGQTHGRKDYELLNAIRDNVIFYIYYRVKGSFIYLGNTRIVNIIQQRKLPKNQHTNYDERLQIHFIVNDVKNELVPKNDFKKSGKFKKDVLVHAGLIKTDGIINYNTNFGFFKFYYNN